MTVGDCGEEFEFNMAGNILDQLCIDSGESCFRDFHPLSILGYRVESRKPERYSLTAPLSHMVFLFPAVSN